MMPIVFFGTSENATPILEALATTQGFKITSVVTQPDRPAGRKATLVPSPVKVAALKLNLPILQPEKLNSFTPPLADAYIVCAYGSIIPKRILNVPTYGSLNIHYSLLPKYRGPSPFHTALMNGDAKTGVTIMLLDETMDHGPILSQNEVAIDPNDTALTLCKKLNTIAAPLLIDTLKKLLNNKITPLDQNHAVASYCHLLTRNDGKIDWHKSPQEIYNLYRGLTPWPGVWTTFEDKRLKLLKLQIKEGKIDILQLQLEGKKPMNIKEFLIGHPNFSISKLG